MKETVNNLEICTNCNGHGRFDSFNYSAKFSERDNCKCNICEGRGFTGEFPYDLFYVIEDELPKPIRDFFEKLKYYRTNYPVIFK